ncbi:MAG TPA: helix-turn-helix domain-containing protein [Actinophytocola sp.]|nr:helix-turn-helix domain-containing protein [Actinophytocola sp.]
MPRPSDTKQRILDTARELFAQKGVQKTSLQEIAGQLGITKPALYYHFPSREELVRSIMQPLIDDGEAFVLAQEQLAETEPRALLEGYFDFNVRRRADIMLVLTELTTLAELGLVDTVLAWRERLTALLYGPSPTLGEATRAVVALGGMQDCTIQFPHVAEAELREAAVTAALATLGLDRAG